MQELKIILFFLSFFFKKDLRDMLFVSIFVAQ